MTTPDTELRIGLLGAGRIGKVHAAVIAQTPHARLVAVADALPEAATALAHEHNAEVSSIDAIIGSDQVDAVFITTPTDIHADLIEQSVRAGKKVFCEKPIDLSVQRVRDCLAVVEEHNGLLMVGFNRRFDPNFAKVRAQIESGAIGNVEMVSIISRDPGPPPLTYMERSGGLFKDMTIHDLDMARFLLGEEPVTVSAIGSVLVDPAIAGVPDIDSAAVTLVTESGKIAQIGNSRRAVYGYDQRIEVHGSEGMVRADNLHETTSVLATAKGFQADPLMDFFIERYMPAYRIEVAAFVDSALNGTPVPATGNDGLRSLILAQAALTSHLERRMVAVDTVG